MDYAQTLARILSMQLGPAYPAEAFERDTLLLGQIPELDSMAVVGILAAIEDETGTAIPDDEVSADVFATFGTLEAFLRRQLGAAG
jgi:acyl carrier protein